MPRKKVVPPTTTLSAAVGAEETPSKDPSNNAFGIDKYELANAHSTSSLLLVQGDALTGEQCLEWRKRWCVLPPPFPLSLERADRVMAEQVPEGVRLQKQVPQALVKSSAVFINYLASMFVPPPSPLLYR